MKNLNQYNFQELTIKEKIEIVGGGERYAYFFGTAVRVALLSLIPGGLIIDGVYRAVRS